MSNRTMKRIQKQKDEENMQKSKVEEEERTNSSDSEEIQKKPVRFTNAFAQLDISGSENGSDHDAEVDLKVQEKVKTSEPNLKPNQTKKNKKKLKKSKKKKQTQNQDVKDNDTEFTKQNENLPSCIQSQIKQENKYEEEEYKSSINQNLQYNPNALQNKVNLVSCLEIKLKLMNYNQEMQRIFKNAKLSEGGHRDDGDDGGEVQSKRQKKMMHLMNQQMKKQNRNVAKKYYLNFCDQPNYGFPVNDRFECKFLKINNYHMKEFCFMPSKKYEIMQQEYEDCRNSLDPNVVFEFLNQNPQHVGALHDVGEYFRLKGNYKEANSCLEQILRIYEDSFSFEFKSIFTDTINEICLSWDENEYAKVLFKCIFKFIDILGKKGCYRSALEYNKFLLKLNPIVDPMGALFCIDYSALSAQDPMYLQFFVSNFCTEVYKQDCTSLALLPNFAYSCAMAGFLIQQKGDDANIVYNAKNAKNAKQKELDISEIVKVTPEEFQRAVELCKGNNNFNLAEQSCNTQLMLAIMLYPHIISNLLVKNEFHKQNVTHSTLQLPAQKQSFKQLLYDQNINGGLFANCKGEGHARQYVPYYSFLKMNTEDDITGYNKICEIYVERNQILWRNNAIAVWVKANLGYIMEMLNTKQLDYEAFMEELVTSETKFNLPFQLAKYKNLAKANFSDREERLDLNNIPDQQPLAQQRQQQHNVVNLNQNLIGLFLSSLLPWNHLPQQQQQEQQLGQGQADQEFQQGDYEEEDEEDI